MPSFVVNYVPGSGFVPIISGNPWSGRVEPVGGMQMRADPANSGGVYISLSGAFAFSGQVGTLVGSGGPTINSGSLAGYQSGLTDGMKLNPADGYFVPRIAFTISGVYPMCAGCDPACSGGFARIYYEMF